jgi:hypothetical protein
MILNSSVALTGYYTQIGPPITRQTGPPVTR